MHKPIRVSFTVRQASVDDSLQVIAGINGICAEEGCFHTDHYVPTPEWEAVLHHPETVPDHLLIVAEVSREFAGAARLFRCANTNGKRYTAELGIFVLPPFRSQGIGSAMISHVLNWAAQQGYAETMLTVLKNNYRAIHTFRKFGFEIQGIYQGHDETGGRAEDRWRMNRVLPASEQQRNSYGTNICSAM